MSLLEKKHALLIEESEITHAQKRTEIENEQYKNLKQKEVEITNLRNELQELKSRKEILSRKVEAKLAELNQMGMERDLVTGETGIPYYHEGRTFYL